MANEGSKQGNPGLGPTVDGLAEGRKLFNNHYTLIKIVGRGPNSVVWLAWNDKQQRDVALKFLPEMTKEDHSALAVLKREIRKLQELKHPALLPIYDVEEDGNMVAIACEYVEGATLSEMRAQRSNQIFAPGDLTESVKQLCSALEYAHGEPNVAHGDLSPSSLMVSQKGAFKIADYGLARYINEFISKTSGRPTNQDIAYQSPQQANGETATAIDDIYSFGATIYELLTSKPPFHTGDIMLQVQQKIPPPMTHRRKELRVIGEPIPRVWEETVASCLQKSPANRPQSIVQVRELLGIVADAPEAAPAPVEVAPAPSGPSPKVKIIGIAAAAVVICALLGAVLAKNSKSSSGSGGGMSAAEQAKMKAENEAAVKKAAKDAEAKAEAKAMANASKATKDAEAKAKAAKEEADRFKAAMEKAQADERKRIADADKARQEADKARLQTEAKLKQAQEDAAKAAQLAKEEAAKMAKNTTTANSAETERLRKEAEKAKKEADDRVMAAKAEADKLKAEIEKARQDEAKRQIEADRARKDNEAKAKAAADEAAKLQAQLAEAKKAQDSEAAKMAAIAAARARQELEERRKEDEKKAAEAKAKADADAKQMAIQMAKRKEEDDAKRVAAAEARKFRMGTKVWDNSLGMRLVPVGKIMVCIWETRYDDFQEFVSAQRYDAGLGWKSSKAGPTHPVVNVNWNDAQAFCKWLTDREKKDGLFSTGSYRLPTDAEWSLIAKLDGESGDTPAQRDMGVRGVYPWGTAWPPPVGAGNYADNVSFDQFDGTAPVGSFKPNAYGIYDLGGNVWEWCDDWLDASQKGKTLRGGSWQGYITGSLLSSYRRSIPSTERRDDVGFRVILDPNK